MMMPALPEGTLDWDPLVAIATGEEQPAGAKTTLATKLETADIGPNQRGEDSPSLKRLEEAPPPIHPSGKLPSIGAGTGSIGLYSARKDLGDTLGEVEPERLIERRAGLRNLAIGAMMFLAAAAVVAAMLLR